MAKPTIIVVDDSRSVRAVVRKGFERAGFEVFDTDCGEQAIRTIMDERPEALLLDLFMPQLPTDEFIARVHAVREAHGLGMKILLHSGRASEELDELCAHYGVDGYIQKARGIRQCISEVNARIRAPACA